MPLLAASQYLLGCVTWELSAQTIDACFGDALSNDQPRLGGVIANQQTYWQIVSIVGQIIVLDSSRTQTIEHNAG